MKNPDGTSKTQDVGFLGIGAATEVVQQPITAVLPAVGNNIVRVAGIIINLPQRLVAVANAAFGSGERDPNGPVSVVGVGRLAGESRASTRCRWPIVRAHSSGWLPR